MTGHIVFIGIGSNLGDKHGHCRMGIKALAEQNTGAVAQVSKFYRTAPVDYADQDWFINAVVQIETDLTPEALIDELKRIEREAGRKDSSVRFGPRELDMDILLYDDLVQTGERVVLPHPRMHKRRFVLKPLCDIAPDMIHPVIGLTMGRLLDQLPEDDQQVEEFSCLN